MGCHEVPMKLIVLSFNFMIVKHKIQCVAELKQYAQTQNYTEAGKTRVAFTHMMQSLAQLLYLTQTQTQNVYRDPTKAC